ncbi:hypothetical protein D3C81_1300100 [compost metagenome]
MVCGKVGSKSIETTETSTTSRILSQLSTSSTALTSSWPALWRTTSSIMPRELLAPAQLIRLRSRTWAWVVTLTLGKTSDIMALPSGWNAHSWPSSSPASARK